MNSRDARRLIGAMMLALALLPMVGCGGGLFGGGSALSIASQRDASVLTPTNRISLYRYSDRNTADFIVSDMSREALDELGTGNTTPTGVIVHVHMFLLPQAGRTPIDATASNATTTVYVFADDAAGVYRGGGFFLPSGRPGGRSYSGRLADADLRLARASDYFGDRLGPSIMSGRISTRRDEQSVGQLIDTLSVLSAQIPAVQPAGLETQP